MDDFCLLYKYNVIKILLLVCLNSALLMYILFAEKRNLVLRLCLNNTFILFVKILQ